MKPSDETIYEGEHSVAFGKVSYNQFEPIVDTWEDWYLVPSSRPTVVQAEPVFKFVDIPGSDFPIDLTTYLSGKPQYGTRKGTLSFLIANGAWHWERIRRDITVALHGKQLQMVLKDDPKYYYNGRFTVSRFEPGAQNSTIDIGYQLDPYKIKIVEEGAEDVIWDTFIFDLDYDYSMFDSIAVPYKGKSTRRFSIYAGDYTFSLSASFLSGSSVMLSFGGASVTLNSSNPSKTFGASVIGKNTLTITGNGNVRIRFRPGYL